MKVLAFKCRFMWWVFRQLHFLADDDLMFDVITVLSV